jgi:hypothetical protein
MRALQVHAGPRARAHIRQNGLRPEHVRVVAGAAGGPKGLVLNPLDRFIFGEWLPQSSHSVHLLGASIGAWRMATACLPEPVHAFERMAETYIEQEYDLPDGRPPTATHVSRIFCSTLDADFAAHEADILAHPRYRLHVFTSRGRHVLGRQGRLRTPIGYLGAFAFNAISRRAMGTWLERVVFSDPREPLPLRLADFRTHAARLDLQNFRPSILASCSIPFWLDAVHDIPGAPRGAYWDGGITDYHLHLDYASMSDGLVLYPHFQASLVPGWLDKGLRHRHRHTPLLDNVVVLAPDPDWVKTLPGGKLPDRHDFHRYKDKAERRRAWRAAVAESQRLSDEFARWIEAPTV